jgi:predicted transposase/invertase (TIGR01784 family)
MRPEPEMEPIILKRRIDPLIDCVFKALFGEESSKGLLISFLNSVLRPAVPITDVTLLNPTHEVARLDGKLTTVDVKALDQAGGILHVEVQLALYPSRSERKLFYWSTMYSRQIVEGVGYEKLKPVTSVWIFRRNIWEDDLHHHRFEVWDRQADLRLSNHLSIHTLELKKWRPSAQGEGAGEDQWLHFLRDACQWDSLPSPLANLPQMRQAMSVLKKFSDDDIAFDIYFRRVDAERLQIERDQLIAQAQQSLDETTHALDETTHALSQAQHALSQAQQEAAQAQQEAAQAQQEAAQAQQEAAQAQQEAARAQQEAAQAQQEAAQASERAQQEAAQAAERALAEGIRQSLLTLYALRFGPAPAALIGLLAAASASRLTSWLPIFASAHDADDLLAQVSVR